MKRLVVTTLLALSVSAGTGRAEERTFQIDPVHSSVQFRIRHLYSTFVGRFNTFEGTLSGDPQKPTTLKVIASVDIASVDTANGDRDKHLRAADFFDAAQHPKAAFESTGTTLGDAKDSGAVAGKLTIRGITKEVTFRGQFLGHGVDPRGASRAGFHATTTINRADFGLTYNAALSNGITVLGNEVELILDLEALEVKPGAAAKPKAQVEAPVPDKAAEDALRLAEKELMASRGQDGLKVGDTAPDFSLPDTAGTKISLYDTLKKGPVVLVFYRGEWCPFCNLQLRSLEKVLPEIQKLGATLLAVSPQMEENATVQSGENHLTFPLLTDGTGETMKAYRLLYNVPEAMQKVYREKFGVDLEKYNGKGRWQLPVTSTYIIDRKAVIRDGLVDFDYTRRMEPDDIIKALKKLE